MNSRQSSNLPAEEEEVILCVFSYKVYVQEIERASIRVKIFTQILCVFDSVFKGKFEQGFWEAPQVLLVSSKISKID